MYCEQCGAALSENAKFCVNCGAPQRQVSAPSAATGFVPASEQVPAQVPKPFPTQAQTISRNTDAKGRRKKGIMNLLMIPVAIILILLGVGYLWLTVAGSETTAQVTNVEQKYYVNNDSSTRDSSRYEIDYQFSVDGKRYTGSVTKTFKGGGQTKQTIPIRYLPFWPHVNTIDDSAMNPAGPIMIGAGILLFVVGVRKKR